MLFTEVKENKTVRLRGKGQHVMQRYFRVSRQYHIRDDNMIRYICSCMKSLSPEDISTRLDSYERYATRNTAKWARTADLEEIIVIMSKAGFPMNITGRDANSKHKAVRMLSWREKFAKDKDVNKLLEEFYQHKFFCTVGRDFLKAQGLFSQLIHGNVYVPNKDFKAFLKHGLQSEGFSDLKNVDIVLGALCLYDGFGDLDVTDLAILYLCKRYDDLPLSGTLLYQTLEYRRDHQLVQRHLAKLIRGEYLYRHGKLSSATYALTDRGMLVLNQARKEFFRDAQFWNQKPDKEIKKANHKSNGATQTKSITEN